MMNKYKLTIQGMHCNGCKNLIALAFEEKDMSDIDVDLSTNTATFESKKDFNEVEDLVAQIFQELENYKYSELIKLN